MSTDQNTAERELAERLARLAARRQPSASKPTASTGANPAPAAPPSPATVSASAGAGPVQPQSMRGSKKEAPSRRAKPAEASRALAGGLSGSVFLGAITLMALNPPSWTVETASPASPSTTLPALLAQAAPTTAAPPQTILVIKEIHRQVYTDQLPQPSGEESATGAPSPASAQSWGPTDSAAENDPGQAADWSQPSSDQSDWAAGPAPESGSVGDPPAPDSQPPAAIAGQPPAPVVTAPPATAPPVVVTSPPTTAAPQPPACKGSKCP